MSEPSAAPCRITLPPWIGEPATQAVIAAFAAAGVEMRFVGGAVRDALLGRALPLPAARIDIDIATPAEPHAVIALLERRGIKTVPTGLTHGTVTAVVPPRQFEITTLRRDVETFGRHARVAFDADWAADAARRDFTINAIFLAPDGVVYDPVGGLADLRAGRLRFVGDPATRIAEDVLRLLRYYRFAARFGSAAGDPQARAACRAAAHLLPGLSGERVAAELFRLLGAPDPGNALQMMAEDGVLAVVLPMPQACRLDRLRRLIAIEPAPDPLRRLAALIDADDRGAVALAERLRLSNACRERLRGLVNADDDPDLLGDPAGWRRVLYRRGAGRFRDRVLLLAAAERIDAGAVAPRLALADRWVPPAFPLGGNDVLALGIPPGPRVGALLDAIERWWAAGDFAAGRDACLAHLAELAAVPADRH
ncbi:MAG TPA: CCA tRNA nucleotidyltransferase [Stellaceae bacterium]|nr:CCA tRNA nucleotidyltransferase [Stellaceae bacterium]